MELLFVRNVNVTDNNKDVIFEAKQKESFYLSVHASHYINLNADDITKQDQSVKRIIAAAEGLIKVKGKSLIFHPGFYLNDSREEAYATIKSNLMKLPDCGVDYRLETTGKGSQFGTLEEARSNGGLRSLNFLCYLLFCCPVGRMDKSKDMKRR